MPKYIKQECKFKTDPWACTFSHGLIGTRLILLPEKVPWKISFHISDKREYRMVILKGRKTEEMLAIIMLALSLEGEPNQSGAVSLSRRERHQRSGNQRGLEFAAHILNG